MSYQGEYEELAAAQLNGNLHWLHDDIYIYQSRVGVGKVGDVYY